MFAPPIAHQDISEDEGSASGAALKLAGDNTVAARWARLPLNLRVMRAREQLSALLRGFIVRNIFKQRPVKVFLSSKWKLGERPCMAETEDMKPVKEGEGSWRECIAETEGMRCVRDGMQLERGNAWRDRRHETCQRRRQKTYVNISEMQHLYPDSSSLIFNVSWKKFNKADSV